MAAQFPQNDLLRPGGDRPPLSKAEASKRIAVLCRLLDLDSRMERDAREAKLLLERLNQLPERN